MKQKNKALLGGAALMVSASMILAGCSGGGSSENELTVWVPTQEESGSNAFDLIVSGFEADNPGTTVKVEQRSVDAHKDAIRQAAGTSAGPDIYMYWEGLGLGGELVDVGMSADLTAYYDEYKWSDRFTGAALAGVTQYGGYHGVPVNQQSMALFYNKELFAQAGITDLPTDYETLVAAADSLVSAGITPIEFGGTVNWHIMRLLDSLLETKCGADLSTQLSLMKASWDDQECVDKAFSELKKWGDSYFPEGYLSMSNEDSSLLFYNGQAAMALEGTWFDSNLVDAGVNPENIGVMQFPTSSGRLYGFGEALYVGAGSKNPDLAAKFIDYLTSDALQQENAGVWGAISVNTNVSPATDNPLHALWVPLVDAADGVYGPSDQNLPSEVTTEYWRVQNSVLTGEIAPKDAGATLQSFIDNTQ